MWTWLKRLGSLWHIKTRVEAVSRNPSHSKSKPRDVFCSGLPYEAQERLIVGALEHMFNYLHRERDRFRCLFLETQCTEIWIVERPSVTFFVHLSDLDDPEGLRLRYRYVEAYNECGDDAPEYAVRVLHRSKTGVIEAKEVKSRWPYVVFRTNVDPAELGSFKLEARTVAPFWERMRHRRPTIEMIAASSPEGIGLEPEACTESPAPENEDTHVRPNSECA